MAAKLVAEEGTLKGLVLSLDEGEQWVIGRDPDVCQILVEDPSASRKHLICRTTPQGILVENLSLTNPTEINDEQVKEPRLLQNGDAVKIGDGLFRFYADAAAHLFKEELKEEPTDSPQMVSHVSIDEQNGAPHDAAQDSKIAPSESSQPPSQEGGTTAVAIAAAATAESQEHAREEPIEEPQASEEEKPAKEPPHEQQAEEHPLEEHQAAEHPVEEPSVEEQQAEEHPLGEHQETEHPIEKPQAQEPQVEDNKSQQLVNTESNKEPPMEALTLEEKLEEDKNTKPTPAATNEDDEHHDDTIFEEEPSDRNALAEINFGLLDTGRWLLKVIGGPNNGAEFSMQSASTYVLGTDPNTCDIVFHDTSVSRQHARISINQDESLAIEDLKSRNGTIVDGEPLTGKRPLSPNTLVTLGTTSFVVYDREGEMQTIISPLMPSIVKVLQSEEEKKETEKNTAPPESEASATPPITEVPVAATPPPAPPAEPQHHITLGAFILIAILTGLFVIVGIGTSTLFKSEPIAVAQAIDPTQALDSALSKFPSVKYTFNKNTGQLLLVGHVLSSSDRSQLLYALQGLNFIKNLDDTGIVIDEYVWGEINQVISKNPEWKGITVMAPTPGHFVVSGYLKTRSQADHLSEYLSANFPYPDLLEKRVVVDEEIVSSINNILLSHNIRNVTVKLDNGEITLTGSVSVGAGGGINAVIPEIKAVRGVRSVRNLAIEVAQDQSMINLSDKYEVSGVSNQAGKLSVVINGRILMKGDVLDGMTITNIQANSVFLEKQGVKYRIDFNR